MKIEKTQPTVDYHVFVISKKSPQGEVLLVKQKEACHCSDKKIEQYRKENRLLIVNLCNQEIMVQKGVTSLKERGIDRIEFKQTDRAIAINHVTELSEEEFSLLMTSSLKEAANQLKAEKVVRGFTQQTGFRNTFSLCDIIHAYIIQNPQLSIDKIISRMLEIWSTAQKDDAEQAKIEEDKKQILHEDLLRRRLLDDVVNENIKAEEALKTLS